MLIDFLYFGLDSLLLCCFVCVCVVYLLLAVECEFVCCLAMMFWVVLVLF